MTYCMYSYTLIEQGSEASLFAMQAGMLGNLLVISVVQSMMAIKKTEISGQSQFLSPFLTETGTTTQFLKSSRVS